jgi:hypothetical protein
MGSSHHNIVLESKFSNFFFFSNLQNLTYIQNPGESKEKLSNYLNWKVPKWS